MSIEDLRREYARHELNEGAADPDPLELFARWFREALASEVSEPNAMTLATVDADGAPRARIVLLKGAEADGFRFFTNYESAKGRELAADDRACLVFLWHELERQVRVEGRAERLPAEESDRYFAARPRDSQLGAWASPQSTELVGRAALEAHLAATMDRFGLEGPVPRPPHWGGYLLRPTAIEFWQGRPARLHDRLRYRRSAGGWERQRLAP
ncbi:pyridoxamine 5'-phosphate oxidase [Engelhardtia mirabilis]|uniref:Pyridoxine/pyridoxamine 5'-phosphate oxidase n=1 Tax=Engelhardtia mirabilis TaxID=2528011 RepID=A0A518BP11_9BACT|nr:Pyridoxine/pyridoxamine 5'-phosphate oxidase [Planctomycetes bacterium Pla133]QDV03038.1 Pyridoxine/pyridoxamine 5'-phosphate oxidase [Planctomycetes bacterium Pla86]